MSSKSLPPIKFPDPTIHKRAVLADAICGALTGLGMAVAVFLLLFVKL